MSYNFNSNKVIKAMFLVNISLMKLKEPQAPKGV